MPALCEAYLAGIETQASAAFDDWFTHAEQSADALAGFLDELLVPNAYRGGSCTLTTANPSAIVLAPLPSTHFQVCAKTDLCRARCADAIAVFEFEKARIGAAASATPPTALSMSVESPFFNPYASSSATTTGGSALLAFASLPTANATADCAARCGSARTTTCLAAARTGLTPGDEYALEFYCLPDPAMLQATLFASGLDPLPLAGAAAMFDRDGYTLAHVDVLWAPGGALPTVLVYAARTLSATTLDGTTSTSEAHEVWAWSSASASAPSSALMMRRKVIGTDDLAAGLLTPSVQRALFAGQALVAPQVLGCTIGAVFALMMSSSSATTTTTLFLALSAQIQGYTTATSDGATQNTKKIQGGYAVNAIVTWASSSSSPSATATATARFYAPCPATCQTATDPTCGGTCNAGLDAALALAGTGTFQSMPLSSLFLLDQSPPAAAVVMLFYLPSSQSPLLAAAAGGLTAHVVCIDVAHGLLLGAAGVCSGGPMMMRLAAANPDTAGFLGTWTRGSVFSSLATAQRKPLRDSRLTALSPTNASMGMRWLQATDGASVGAGQWLYETRALLTAGGWVLRAFRSQTTVADATLAIECTYLSCMGCGTARLRLLCHQAQDCVLGQCVGTVIQTRDVLCGVGSVLQQSTRHAIVTWRALFETMTELGLLAMRGLSGEILTRVVLRFPTEQVRIARSRSRRSDSFIHCRHSTAQRRT